MRCTSILCVCVFFFVCVSRFIFRLSVSNLCISFLCTVHHVIWKLFSLPTISLIIPIFVLCFICSWTFDSRLIDVIFVSTKPFIKCKCERKTRTLIYSTWSPIIENVMFYCVFHRMNHAYDVCVRHAYCVHAFHFQYSHAALNFCFGRMLFAIIVAMARKKPTSTAHFICANKWGGVVSLQFQGT